MKEEFYTQGRWQNWINKIKESGFTLRESDEDPSAAVFVYAMDDVVLACLKVIARCEHGTISKEEAIATIDEIRDIVSERDESLGEDANLMLESLNTALTAVFIASQRYIEGDYDKNTTLEDLVKRAVIAEDTGQMEEALGILSEIGARVIGGESLPEEAFADLPYCLTAELLDGIDAISAAQIGDDSYKEDDGSEDDGEDS
ncbi:MAG: DUF2150 family protein [Methanothrix sp.]|jgi:Uncharacterized protein conserved in archaea|uniref:DUF2150 domain-containing protein n=1 Tax=Methanothrix harundinacea TaxID=301375 RepID=A0A101IL89_9EURY|nr:MAG: hypothetical protein APR56_07025 [Methanosaeta sp. SDB]KUK44918.1 MAG: Uncharacterized protein XD72_0744 [Methanothrix harundinacea]MDD3709972.1 DUF2150 family protein [Methanothrix sp.]MDI9398030.1 DUF2150 family protein [Euryarchaeota archaeon]KUK97276.1 MAG: Uncharacterized protein XE07_0431 [Methanothrix harundinacea]